MKKPLSSTASAVQASTTLAIDAMFKKMKADGQDVVGFGAGEPDFNTPDFIKKAGHEALDKNLTRYTPAAGTEALRLAIGRQIERDYGISYKPSQILVSSGAKHNVFIALMCLCDPGDEVILPAPYWVSYYELIRMAGGVPVVVQTTEKDGFRVTAEAIEAAVTPKTKALILNSPSNPTGMVYDRAALESIAGVCVKHGIYVMADEIYDKLVYDGREFVSFPSLGQDVYDLTILINGVSKSFAMTGWRIGWACANPELSKVMANYQSHSTSGPSSISQAASLAALDGPTDELIAMREAFQQRRDYAVERINSIEGVSCLKPEGAFYIMLNVQKVLGKTLYGAQIDSADTFAKLWLEKGGVAAVPCEGFGAPGFIRLSYATSMENLTKGLDRLESFLKG